MKGIKSINCVVETPKGYGIKYDYDPRLGRLFVKKRLPAGLVFPLILAIYLVQWERTATR
ncbi:inorganic diphosphatase [Niabella defluvii]|nr:inorganic diphosphatase [Niabella sp. I65]